MDSPRQDVSFTQLLQDQSHDNNFVTNTSTLAQNENYQPAQSKKKGTKKKSRGDNFCLEEDVILVNGWLSTSLDAIVGNDQKFNTLWGRIRMYYLECKKPNFQDRTEHYLMNRWSTIRHSVNKFCGCLAEIENSRPSGYNETDKIKMAKIAYKESEGSYFKFDHCFDILQYQPKWILQKEEDMMKKKRGASDLPFTKETIDLDDDVTFSEKSAYCERPPGKKAQKANEKKRKDKEEKSAQIENMVSSLIEEKKKLHEEKMGKIDMLAEIEERRVAQKDRLAAQKDRLVAIAEKRLEFEENEKIDRIMMMDISKMDVVQQEYFQKRRLEILQNMKKH